MSPAAELPSGTVTFLFTDIEGSTRLLKQFRDRYGELLADHERILRDAFDEYDGREIDTQGDSFFVAFPRAKDAVAAAVLAQRRLREHAWPDGAEVRVRMGLHTGEPTVGGERYVGLGVHRAARISAAGHGGQVLVSQTTRELLRDDPLPDVSLRDLGEYQLKDLDEPERIFQLVSPGLDAEFPPLKTAAAGPLEGREQELVKAAAETVAILERPWWRRSRALTAGGVAALAAVVVIAAVLVTRGGGTASAADRVDANAVGVVDSSGRIRGQTGVGTAPGGVTAGDGAVWVANTDDNSVSRIDPATNDVRQTILVGGGPTDVVAHAGTVWVTNGLDGTVSRIDAATNQVVQTITVGNGPTGIAYGAHGVWVANSVDGTMSRIDPATGRVGRTIPVSIGASGVAYGFGRLWVVSASAGGLFAVDPRSGDVVERIPVGVDPEAVTVGAGSVWVANRADGTVMRIDPRARAVVDTIEVGHAPAALAAAAGAVWVANSADGTLSRIDAGAGKVVRTVRLANSPNGLAVSPRGVYVAVRSTGQSHRGGTLRVVSFFGLDFVDPAVAYSGDSWSILAVTNDGLVSFRRVGGVEGVELVPDLAESLPTPSDGGTTYTFRLRPGIRFSNGRLVQPADVRREIERVLEERPPSPGRQYYTGIVGAQRCIPGKRCDLTGGIATDALARTVTFHLTQPDGDFLAKLALPFAVAVPADTPGRVIKRPLPATGPYRILAWTRSGIARLVRNPRFSQWSQDAQPDGYPDRIELSTVQSATARIKAVTSGAAELARSLDAGGTKQELDTLATQFPSQLHVSTESGTHYFFLNTRLRPFDDLRVRLAVNDAFDRRAYGKLLGRAFVPTCQILPPILPGYRRTCTYPPNRPGTLDKARRLVRSSGTAGTSVTVWMPQAEDSRLRGGFMVSLLRSLGYGARLRLLSRNAYFPTVNDSRSRAQTGFAGWQTDYPAASGFLQPQFTCADFKPASPDETSDPSELCNRFVDGAIAHAESVQAQDPAAAGAAWRAAERAILGQAPVVPTVNPRNADLVSRRVGNYQFNPQLGVLIDQLWVR
jgi:peptide/nickel transport system substrate-binding protein